MALRFAYGVLLFCLLLLRCDHISGARAVVKDSYESAYGTKENLEDPSGYASGYAAAYRTQKVAKDSYESAYGSKENLEDQSGYASGYAAAYQTKKDAKDTNYITAYGTKDLYAKYAEMEDVPEDQNPANEVKDVDERHLKQEEVANQKEMNQPYIAGYTSKQANYITAYRTRQDGEETYLAKYGTKEDSKDSGMKNKTQNHAHGMNDVAEKHLKEVEADNQKEMNEQYIAGYRNKQYIAGYRNRQYIAGYRTRKDAKDNYITAKEALKNSGMQYKKHCGQIDNDVKDVADQNLQQVEVAREKEMNQPNIAGYRQYEAGYGNRQYGAGYGAGYGNKQYGAGYGAGYGNKQYEAGYGSRQYGAGYGAGYGNRQYEAGYGNRQDAKDNYIAGYTGKSDQGPYIAGYRSAKDVKELDYISSCGDGKDSRESSMVHENHMAAKPSSHMDRSEAFKSGFFTMDDLFVGKTMPLRFPIQEFPHFLPREEADSIPFSMAQLSNVLQLYSILPGSPSAQAMENTLQQCESLPTKGEIKHCATSLESMLGFVHNIMGSWANLDVLTITHPTVATVSAQNYSVLRISEEIYAPKWVACHPLLYPYKVFYCHFIERSKIFKVLLGGENEHKVEAVAVCHMDTSDWDPDHILFRQLGIKPGSSSPICHFLPVYHLVWVPSPTPATASI
ncbi:polygalacturonase-1 non-catalytic subunit beta-like isoform X3 [Juglans microcarpa x Juglans regia]|uniref:polygalacturonase-1 non-catalytic subunit beta-like isoform X3 n=1 Tax=Juglans microcarpa x Juglans regia TaxID=2249226 RepID=UPI001B7E39F5|nr:polygalacturonase-1 non-catalytic subunit beta-like isoform X3 [Juglans microcarpa x Juglans regia]